MPTDLGKQFGNTWTGRPPHMSSQDWAIWQRWHAFRAKDFMGFYYDCAVGEGTKPPEGGTDKQRAAWIRITQKRIDAIGIRADAIWIIEVRPSAGSSAMGALLTYDHLLKDDNPFALPIRLALVTDATDNDFRRVLKAYGIQVFEV